MARLMDERTLEKRIEALCAERGDTVDVNEITQIVENLMRSMSNDLSDVEKEIHHEINELVNYIRNVKNTIALIQPNKIKLVYIPDATDELDAIVSMTETATNTILEMVECIEDSIDVMPPEIAEKTNIAVTKIYEACNFQDITGQRVKKIVEALQYIDEKVENLAKIVGHTKDIEPETTKPPPSDDDLIHGPQLPENATSQADIDALFD